MGAIIVGIIAYGASMQNRQGGVTSGTAPFSTPSVAEEKTNQPTETESEVPEVTNTNKDIDQELNEIEKELKAADKEDLSWQDL